MGLLQKLKAGLRKTHSKFTHEIRRIVTRSPKLTGETLEELEMVLIGADFGHAMTQHILDAARRAYETQGRTGLEILQVARAEVQQALATESTALQREEGLTVVLLVGVNGTGKTTTSAKLARLVQTQGHHALLAACDTFRAAAIEQLKLWGDRLGVEVVAGDYHADPAAVAHDALSAAQARKADYLFVDTAGRLHTKSNLMQELQKVHRVLGRLLPGAPHEVLLVVDATTGMNALVQARAFHKAVPLTGLIVTKLDGTSKGGMIVAIHRELGLPVKFVGVGEKPDDLQPFDPAQYAEALFAEDE